MVAQHGKRGGRRERLAQRAAKPAVDPCPPGQIGGTYKPLSDSDLRRISDTALDLLEKLGIGEVPDRLHADLLTKTLQSVQQVADPAKPGWFNEATTVLPVPAGDALQDELRAFVLTCQGREAEVVHPGGPQATDGLAAQRVCDAIQRAVP